SHHEKITVTGCPIRQEMITLPPREEAAKRLGLDRKLNTLMITGASQGAQTVNEATLESLKSIKLQGWNILHLAGKDHAPAVRAGYRELEIPAVVIDFTPAMNDIWAVTDLAIARSGASTCAELTACGIASILFPYPFHKDMHQRANAQVLADAGAAILLDDKKDRKQNAEALRPVLNSLLYNASARRKMGEVARTLGHPNAASEVAQVMQSMLP
ncbi:MAG TPA: UDP-N-acetylglucosamine--N-acetylmuramyl-(pentapeptide) pyrophosphoryl-undecaprenol N-acetylglucosamine transferase, partial [Tepidisphaeraceae bacterium]